MKNQKKSNLKDNTRIYTPKNIVPRGESYVLTDNYTAENGRVYNRSDIDAELGKKWVDENHK